MGRGTNTIGELLQYQILIFLKIIFLPILKFYWSSLRCSKFLNDLSEEDSSIVAPEISYIYWPILTLSFFYIYPL